MYRGVRLAALSASAFAALALAGGSAVASTAAEGGSAVASIAAGGVGVEIPAARLPGAHAHAADATHAEAGRATTEVGSENWSGYAQVGSATKVFTAVKGTWTVPTVTTSSGDQFSSDWVGIDGAGNNTTLIQDGTESDNDNGQAHYDAWTEILPASEVVTPLVIHPGDQIEGLVQETATNKWVMTVMDLTTGKSFSRTVNYTTPQQDVEAIHERPEVGGSLATLATTTNVTQLPDFYSTAAPGQTPVWTALGDTDGTTLDQIFMVNNNDTAIIASPSALNSADDGFTVADGAQSPPAP